MSVRGGTCLWFRLLHLHQ
ncbi:hypothetical protein SRHO_G00150210 [Serrasalmus rhombeus]